MTEIYAGLCDECGTIHRVDREAKLDWNGDTSIYPTDCGASKPNGHTCHSTLYMHHFETEGEFQDLSKDWQEKRLAHEDA